MRQKKLLSKVLSVLLSGAMLVGTIPAAAFAEDYAPPMLAEADSAIEGHTRDGYTSMWSEGFENIAMPSGWSTNDINADGRDWEVAYNSAEGFTAHHGDGCVYSTSWERESGAFTPNNRLILPTMTLMCVNQHVLTFMATGTGTNYAEKFTVNISTDGGATYTQLGDAYTTTNEWQEIEVDLKEYEGQKVTIAIDHKDCTGQNALLLDCFNVWGKQVHSVEGYPYVSYWEDFESENLPYGYLADADTWHTVEGAGHHGSYCLKSYPDGKVVGISPSHNLQVPNVALKKNMDTMLSFMVKGENAGTLKILVQLDGKTYEVYSEAVNSTTWQQVTADLDGFGGRTVDIYICQYVDTVNYQPMYIDCAGLFEKPAHYKADGRTLVWSEDFEESGLPDDWGAVEYDSNDYNWEVDYQGSGIKKHHGEGAVYSDSSQTASGDELETNNWLLLPTKALGSGKRYILTFDAVEQTNGDVEKFGVYVSTNGGTNYTKLGEDYTTTYEWQEIEVDLSAYVGKNVDIAVVHHNCIDQGTLVLDCFNLWELPLKEITSIKANITEPKIGDTPAATATFTTEPAGGVAEHSIAWSKVPEADYNGKATTGWSALEENEKFEAGYYYAMEMLVYFNTGYVAASSLSGKVNSFETYEYSEPGSSIMQLAAIVPPLSTDITSIAATITEPVIGATPDFDPVVKFTPENSAYVDFGGVYWAKIAKADYTGNSQKDEWFAVGATEKFEAGYIYSVEISMSPEDGYKVGDECTGTINGEPHDDYWGPFVDDRANPCLFMRFEPKTAVTSISATITPPVIGETVDFDPVITSSPANSVELDSIYWLRILKEKYTGTSSDSWDIVPMSAKVESGYYYSPILNLSAKGGFAITPDTVGTINSRPHVDTYGELFDSPSLAFLTVGFDPEIPNTVPTAGDGQVALSWNKVPGATKYIVYSILNGQYTNRGTTTATSFTVTGLTNGTKYGFIVAAYVGGSWTSLSTDYIVYATPVSTKPQNVKATPGNGKVDIKWNAVDGATKYIVYSILDGKYTNRGTTTATSFTVSGLTNGTKYGFLVQAYVNGAWSSFTANDIVYATPVAKPAITVTPGNSQVTVKWNAVSGATKYIVYSILDGKYTNRGTTTGTSFTVTGLTNNTKYGFLVQAYVNGAWTPFTSDDIKYATPTAPLKPVITVTPGNAQVSIKWNAVDGATKYIVYSILNGTYTNRGTTTGTSFTVTGLTNNTKYGFLVQAYVDGAWTKFTADDIKYATPVAATKPVITLTAGDSKVDIKWGAVDGATKYIVYSILNGTYTNRGTTTGTSFTVTGLTNNTKYGFLVQAYVDGAWTKFTSEDIKYATPTAPLKPVITVTPGNAQVSIKWNAVSGATKYIVYSILDGKYTNRGTTTATSFTVTGLANGTKYGFLVQAYVDGAWTKFTAEDIKYATPTAPLKPVITVTPGNAQVSIKWNAVSGATKYIVYSILNGTYTNRGTTTGTSFTVTGLTNNTKYGFLVQAYVDGAWTKFTAEDIKYATPTA